MKPGISTLVSGVSTITQIGMLDRTGERPGAGDPLMRCVRLQIIRGLLLQYYKILQARLFFVRKRISGFKTIRRMSNASISRVPKPIARLWDKWKAAAATAA